MFRNLIFGLFVIPMSLVCENSAATKTETLKLSHDFIIQNLGKSDIKEFQKTLVKNHSSDCREQIRNAVCVSDSEDPGFDANCSKTEVPESIIDILAELSEELPAFHKKVYCHVDRIQIHNKIFSMAYAGMIYGGGTVTGTIIGIKKELLNRKFEGDPFSWKEQLNFGLTRLDDPARIPTEHGPFEKIRLNSEAPTLLYVLVHEINHLIDFLNNANSVDLNNCVNIDGSDFKFDCVVPKTSFSSLSWGDRELVYFGQPPADYVYVAPKPTGFEKFPLLSKLCFYYCNDSFISVQDIDATYAELGQSSFLTTYSVMSSREDFAEAATIWAFKNSESQVGLQYLNREGKVLFDTSLQLELPLIKAKMDWLDQFFANPDLAYRFVN